MEKLEKLFLTTIKNKWTLIGFLLFFSFFPTTIAQEPVNAGQHEINSKVEIYNDQDWLLFEEVEPLRLSLAFDRKLFRKNTIKEEYQPAVLSVHLPDTVIDRDIRIRARGITRKTICTFPPIKLNLKEADLGDTQLKHQSTLKMVTHCKNSNMYQKYIFKEYLVYKLYNLLTDYSLKVRLVQIDYIDTGPKQKVITKYGFLIEHIDALARRMDCEEVENEYLPQKNMNKEIMPLLCVFQYMMGNTDWSLAGLHNIKVIQSKNPTDFEPYPIPYDFDYAGFVDTEYAIPAEGLGLDSVKDRYYRCICFEESSIFESVDLIASKKDAMFKLIEDFEYLTKNEKAFLTKYLNDYFEPMENDKVIRRDLIDPCIK
ncbi:MAG: hypothetical protein QNK30_04330 [Bacteroidales bacterium]|nr:hypothetical protein [Bacteroidales bacterium]